MNLLLESLEIENYRVFRKLRIERLGRANLFVGKNNTGKSSILEAVRLYASRGHQDVLWAILESHDETKLSPSGPLEDRLFAVRQLFHGRDEWKDGSEIRIGPIHDIPLTIRLGAPPPDAHDTNFEMPNSRARLARRLGVVSEFPGAADSLPPQFHVSPNGIAGHEAARLWDLIALTDLEQYVIEALRIISREIDRISFIGQPGPNRVPVAKLASQIRPVALRSLGDGINRMLGIALSLVSAKGGVLLIDEVENGIHFTAQTQLWQMIFRLAHRLNTQVFATTHSWDCIEAFQHAATIDGHEEAVLIRLDAQDDTVLPTTFTERDLSIVTREQIEVR